MGASPSPTIINIFRNYLKTKYLVEYPIDCKSQFYRQYLDDTFFIFNNKLHAKQVFNFINSMHSHIKLTFEGKIDGTLVF